MVVVERSLYKYILKHTLKDQVFLMLITAATMPFVYWSLVVPKIIINSAIGGENLPAEVLGVPINQIKYLMLLSIVFLLLIIINGVLKYIVNVYRGVLGERMLRRFRYELYSRLLRFPLPHFRRVSQGEIIPMLVTETEPLGGFIGDAFALPAFQGGLLATYLAFIFIQDPWLGLAAVALYPPQIVVIPRLQRKVNQLAKQRVQQVRRFGDHLGESIAGVAEIHGHDTVRFERARVADRLGTIFAIRFEIYRRKFFIKFLNNFLGNLTPFFFYSIGGYLVIQGRLSLGALVAVLAAYKDITPPWKELLKYYQDKEDIRIKYAQIIEQFDPPGILEASLQEPPEESIESLDGELKASKLSYGDETRPQVLEAVDLCIDLTEHVAVLGLAGSGKDELSRLLARLLWPTAGRIQIGARILTELPEAVTGRRIAYVDQTSYIFTGTVGDNLVYGLKHRPTSQRDGVERENFMREARASGNSPDDLQAEWVDFQSAGATDAVSLHGPILEVLHAVSLQDDIFEFGLRGRLNPAQYPALADGVLQARQVLNQKLQHSQARSLVEPFESNAFIAGMTVAENLLFGAAVDDAFAVANLSRNADVLAVLHDTGLYDAFLAMGRKVAELMVELFVDVSPDSDLFSEYSFIRSEELPAYGALVAKLRSTSMQELTDDERSMLLSLPFMLIAARHRLGLIDAAFIERLLDARHRLAERLAQRHDAVELFDPQRINPAVSLQDNILFGRIVQSEARAPATVAKLLRETVDELDLRRLIACVGLDYAVGVAGSRLSPAQRQQLALARCLLKQPDLLIVNEATSALDSETESRLFERVLAYRQGRGVIWVPGRPEFARHFDKVAVLEQGRLVGFGSYAEVRNAASPRTTGGE